MAAARTLLTGYVHNEADVVDLATALDAYKARRDQWPTEMAMTEAREFLRPRGFYEDGTPTKKFARAFDAFAFGHDDVVRAALLDCQPKSVDDATHVSMKWLLALKAKAELVFPRKS